MGVNREYVADWTNISFNNKESLLFLQYMKRKSLAGSLEHKIYTTTPTAKNIYFGGNMTFTNKIIFIPYNSDPKWNFYNLDELSNDYINRRVSTISGYTTVINAYCGGVLNDEGRLYFSPYNQATATTWHYVDANDNFVAYSHGVTCVQGAYVGGALGINGDIDNCIYFAPHNQATATTWHYIDRTGVVNSYSAPNNVVDKGYWGAVCNEEGRIYFIPYQQTTAAYWHYIDSNGSVHAYQNNKQAELIYDQYIFAGGVLDSDNKIYLVPYTYNKKWYYIYHNQVYSYDGEELVNEAYIGGVLAPNGRIYLIPYGQATATTWHYIDTTKAPGDAGHVVPYSHGLTCVEKAYAGGVLAPNGRIYLIPHNQGEAPAYHFIDTQSTEDINSTVATSPFYNKL